MRDEQFPGCSMIRGFPEEIMFVLRWGVTVLLFGFTALSSAQDYPSKVIRIIASGPGGGGDFDARQIAQGIAPALGQSVIVENRPNNVIGESIAKSPPDGYMLFVAGG